MKPKAVLRVAESLAAHLTPDGAFRVICEILHHEFGVARASLAIYDEERNDFNVVAMEVDDETGFGAGLRLPRAGTRVGEVFDSGEIMRETDLSLDSPYQEDRFLAGAGLKTGITLPIFHGGETVGTLNFDWRESSALYPELEHLLASFAGMLGSSAAMSWWRPSRKRSLPLDPEDMILKRLSMRQDLTKLRRLAASDASILIFGETGTGKGVLAKAIHGWSRRHEAAFVKCDCTALTESLIESELFGHEKGSYTGATGQRLGKFELANRGTVFIDEIGEMPLEFQPKLLGVIEEQEVVRVGGSQTVPLDFRVISATHRDLRSEIKDDRFRMDLFQRLNVVEYRLKPLRDTQEDIAQLAELFITHQAGRLGIRPPKLDAAGLAVLKSYHWPGNVRELSHLIERAVLLNDGRVLNLPSELFEPVESSHFDVELPLEEVERRHIVSALKRCDWQVGGDAGAATLLDMHPNTLRSRMQKLGIERPIS